MMPNTVLLLELNPTRSNSSKVGANLWVAEVTNTSTGYYSGERTVTNEVDTKPRVAYYARWRLGPPPGVNLTTKVLKVELNH